MVLQRSAGNEHYHFDTAAGRYIVMCFFGSATHESAREALSLLDTSRSLFDDDNISFFGVSVDPTDEREQRVRESLPGVRYIWDGDGRVSRLYGALPREESTPATDMYAPTWFVLDPALRILNVIPFRKDRQDLAAIRDALKTLPAVSACADKSPHAPVLILPRVFEPALCRELIGLYVNHGGQESGFMNDEAGRNGSPLRSCAQNSQGFRVQQPA